MKRNLLFALLALSTQTFYGQKTLEVTVSNPVNTPREAQPVVLSLLPYQLQTKSALVTLDGKEIPSQLDDLNGDGIYDELCFMTDITKKGKQTFRVELQETGEPRQYESKVYADMMLTNRKINSSNKQDLYISSLTVDNGTNPYWMLHHHGPAFENELVAYRIYFDHRQTVDTYGKYRKGLELKQTQFYPDEEQKAAGFGDDVLWVGNTFGAGALRGWDGNEPQMLTDVDHRTLRIVSRGPLRTIVEVIDEGWNTMNPGKEKITMNTLYKLYAGRRDVQVDIRFNRSAKGYQFATGLINVKESEEYSDHAGLRGCWGTDWPVSLKDSAGHKRETVGLGICIPRKNMAKELPANKDNYPFIVSTDTQTLSYHISFGSDNESFGYHSAKDWFEYLQAWKRDLEQPLQVSVAEK
ncbi:MAG: DUF4861 domain-containing protein [Prevotella sp.]|nr:DUF4861 domain-containing protein [Prevotella sp.]